MKIPLTNLFEKYLNLKDVSSKKEVQDIAKKLATLNVDELKQEIANSQEDDLDVQRMTDILRSELNNPVTDME